MTLRLKLACAMVFAALLPMVVAVVVTLLRAERRAQQEAGERLEAARRQALILLDRHELETEGRLARAAADLLRDPSGLEELLGSESRPGSSRLAVSLAGRFGLDFVEIMNADGTVLSDSTSEETYGLASPLADVKEAGVELRPLPETFPALDAPIAFIARRSVNVGKLVLSVVGGRSVGRELIAVIASVTGRRSELVDGAGSIVLAEEPHGAADTSEQLASEVPLGEAGWRIRVQAPAADVRRTRRELLEVFAGIAPFALLSAVAVATILAEGISRPIRALAQRADEITAKAAWPFTIPPARDEVRRLTLSFDRMLEARSDSEIRRIAAERVAAWQGVARRIAHEVKNPLSPIKLAVENLRRTREKAPDRLDRALDEETTIILEEVESLRRLVDEFSQFARLPEPQLARCAVSEIASQALGLFASRIEQAGVRVAFRTQDPLPAILADADQIGRALKNVLANALDAMEPVSSRRLEVIARPFGPDPERFVEIQVRDSGVGFEPEALERVFEPYYTTRSERGGTGLGMAITHRIITEHGGSIHASGSPGSGATITIRLPVDGPDAARA